VGQEIIFRVFSIRREEDYNTNHLTCKHWSALINDTIVCLCALSAWQVKQVRQIGSNRNGITKQHSLQAFQRKSCPFPFVLIVHHEAVCKNNHLMLATVHHATIQIHICVWQHIRCNRPTSYIQLNFRRKYNCYRSNRDNSQIQKRYRNLSN